MSLIFISLFSYTLCSGLSNKQYGSSVAYLQAISAVLSCCFFVIISVISVPFKVGIFCPPSFALFFSSSCDLFGFLMNQGCFDKRHVFKIPGGWGSPILLVG